METKSKFEELSDRVLFYIMKKYYDKYGTNWMGDDIKLITDELNEITEGMGLGQNSSLDVDYLMCVYQDNYYLISNDNPTKKLIRRKLTSYSAEIDVWETNYVRSTYRHEISSYNPENVIPILQYMTYEGDISVWEGREMGSEVYDSDLTDEKWDKSSVKKINSIKK